MSLLRTKKTSIYLEIASNQELARKVLRTISKKCRKRVRFREESDHNRENLNDREKNGEHQFLEEGCRGFFKRADS
ncbi:hypothetical protein CEXT_200011 [Caerostris extrusa]|uniref:Uncharacterized protein n=1 Tax=Caerostris extrusa TaxID=172846 RepID=A0AAV4YB14_CAEEX|nr:hypothetical protein CEXT_200011 [Caerostris extrusa]